MQKTTWPLLFTLLATFKALAAPSSGIIEVTARDSLTGQGLTATTQWLASDGATPTRAWQTRLGHQSRLQLPTGLQRLRIFAAGHRPLETQFNVLRGDVVHATIWLDPVIVPDELRPESVRQLAIPGTATIHDYVVDASTGAPLVGVTLRLKEQSVRSDVRGYFALQIPLLPGGSDSLSESADLIAERSGYKTHSLKNTLLPEGLT